jgi:hypothetical protein
MGQHRRLGHNHDAACQQPLTLLGLAMHTAVCLSNRFPIPTASDWSGGMPYTLLLSVQKILKTISEKYSLPKHYYACSSAIGTTDWANGSKTWSPVSSSAPRSSCLLRPIPRTLPFDHRLLMHTPNALRFHNLSTIWARSKGSTSANLSRADGPQFIVPTSNPFVA